MSFMKRYLAGEHKSVWDELFAIGEGVYQEPLYSDAIAVARETMFRIHQNILNIIPRLESKGYIFGYDWAQSLIEEEQLAGTYETFEFIKQAPARFAFPDSNVQSLLQQLEKIGGTLPLSIRAWYEEIGAVNFSGTPPLTWKNPWKTVRDKTSSFDWGGWLIDSKVEKLPFHNLDPLYIHDIHYLINQADYLQKRDLYKNGIDVDLSIDEFLKCRTSGSGGYGMHLPNARIDAAFEGEWHQTTFVNYLRICFQWGGLPGLETWTIPIEDLVFLREGIIAF